MERLHYNIKGMSCAACVAHVERAVKSVLEEGDSFTVSLLSNSVSIIKEKSFQNDGEKEMLEQRLASAVKAAGYILLTTEPPKDSQSKELQNHLIKLIVSAFFTLLVMYIAMGGMVGLPVPGFLVGTENALIMAMTQLCVILPVLILNRKFFINGFSALIHRSPNMDSLIAVGSGASVLYGLVAVVMIAIAQKNGDTEAVHGWIHDLYFESAAMILTLVSFGKLLESRAKNKAADAVKSLATLAPKYATVIRDGKESSVSVEEVQVGDMLLIRAGELIPVDGEVTEGRGSADESALTGESMPVEKEIGSKVHAACVLTSGALTVTATEVGENTSLSRIIRLLEDAAASKAPIARIADKVSGVFVPVVMGISLVTFVIWMICTAHVEQALRSAIAVLVISCPCALGLATPTAITVGIGQGAKSGILFRSAEALEKLCGVKTVVFDKTGTVTEGRPSLTQIYAYGEDPMHILSLAASVERLSSHPLALAVQQAAETAGAELFEVTDFEALVGAGAVGTVCGVRCYVGKPRQEDLRNISTAVEEGSDQQAESFACGSECGFKESFASIRAYKTAKSLWSDFAALEKEGKTAVIVTLDGGEPVAVLGISDRIRSDSKDAVNTLKTAGVTCLMLTGDNSRTAEFVAKETNLDGFYAGLLPEDKERMVKELCEKSPCAMVGDGINDAPALVRADVGIAVGAGTEVAIDCAGVVLAGSSLTGVAQAFALSRATIRIIKQNLFWALFYNAICIPVAAGLLYPLFQIQLSPMIASAAMSFSSVCVVTNALRLKRVKLSVSQNKQNKKDKKQESEETSMFGKAKAQTYVMEVEGMMCPRCVAHVKSALEAVKGVESVEVSLENKNATIKASVKSTDLLKKAVTDAGYTVGNIAQQD